MLTAIKKHLTDIFDEGRRGSTLAIITGDQAVVGAINNRVDVKTNITPEHMSIL